MWQPSAANTVIGAAGQACRRRTNSMGSGGPGSSIRSTNIRGHLDEDEARRRSVRSPQPPSDRLAAHRKRGVEHGSVARDPPPRCRRCGEHEQTRDRAWSPRRPLVCDRRRVSVRPRKDDRRKAHLLVELAEGRLDGDQLRLDLDHEQRVALDVPAHDVDRAALTEVGIRHLDLGAPTSVSEHRDSRTDERGVTLVQEPVECTAPPAKVDFDPCFERLGDRPQRGHGDFVDVPRLEPGDHRLAHVRCGPEVPLPPPATPTKSAVGRAETRVIHARTVSGPAQLARIGCRSSTPALDLAPNGRGATRARLRRRGPGRPSGECRDRPTPPWLPCRWT